MKASLPPASLLAVIALALLGCGGGDHDHAGHDHVHDHDHDHGDHSHSADYVPADGEKAAKKAAGPNGGRVVTSVEPAVEFLVTEDRKVRLTFLDAALKPIPAATQSASLIAGDRSAPVRLAFAKDGDTLLSDGTLPDGEDYPTVLQIKVDENAAPVLEKFNLDLSGCPTCEYKEYACVCDH